jgi:hypothetical protein
MRRLSGGREVRLCCLSVCLSVVADSSACLASKSLRVWLSAYSTKSMANSGDIKTSKNRTTAYDHLLVEAQRCPKHKWLDGTKKHKATATSRSLGDMKQASVSDAACTVTVTFVCSRTTKLTRLQIRISSQLAVLLLTHTHAHTRTITVRSWTLQATPGNSKHCVLFANAIKTI